MGKSKLTILGLLLLIAGCAGLAGYHKKDKFFQTSRAFENAMRWSDFDSAKAFLKDSETEDKLADEAKLKMIRVTDYQVKETMVASDETEVLQLVDIQYYRVDSLIVRTLQDRQLWQWNSDKKMWYLKSGFPNFK
jgi:hypothetical protein